MQGGPVSLGGALFRGLLQSVSQRSPLLSLPSVENPHFNGMLAHREVRGQRAAPQVG